MCGFLEVRYRVIYHVYNTQVFYETCNDGDPATISIGVYLAVDESPDLSSLSSSSNSQSPISSAE